MAAYRIARMLMITAVYARRIQRSRLVAVAVDWRVRIPADLSVTGVPLVSRLGRLLAHDPITICR